MIYFFLLRKLQQHGQLMVTFWADGISLWHQSENPTIHQSINRQPNQTSPESKWSITNKVSPKQQENKREKNCSPDWPICVADTWWRISLEINVPIQKSDPSLEAWKTSLCPAGSCSGELLSAVLHASNWPFLLHFTAPLSDMLDLCEYPWSPTSTLSLEHMKFLWCL